MIDLASEQRKLRPRHAKRVGQFQQKQRRILLFTAACAAPFLDEAWNIE